MNQRQMEFLSTSLKSSTPKKTRKPTQGKIVPVMKGAPPRKPLPGANAGVRPGDRTTPTSQNANAMGVARQQTELQKPVSTAINVSYESDPVLARIRAIGGQDVANARSEAEALRKKAIIDSGLTDVGGELGVDQATLQAAAANPFSASRDIERQGLERGRELDENLNQSNLFYGGYRADRLAELARNQAQAQTSLTGDIRGLLGQIDGGVRDAELGAYRQEQEALAQVAEQERLAALQQSFIDALYPPEPDPVAAPSLAPVPGMPYTPMQDYYDQYGVDPYTSDNLAYQLALQQGNPYY